MCADINHILPYFQLLNTFPSLSLNFLKEMASSEQAGNYRDTLNEFFSMTDASIFFGGEGFLTQSAFQLISQYYPNFTKIKIQKNSFGLRESFLMQVRVRDGLPPYDSRCIVHEDTCSGNVHLRQCIQFSVYPLAIIRAQIITEMLISQLYSDDGLGQTGNLIN